MHTRNRIDNKIKKKELEIQELDAKIREERAYIQALQDTLKMLPRGIGSRRSAFKKGSQMDKTYKLLKQAGAPIHITKIMEGIGISLSKRASLASALNAYVKKDEIFTRPSPGTYGLREFGDSNESNEPPSDFGTVNNIQTDEEPSGLEFLD